MEPVSFRNKTAVGVWLVAGGSLGVALIMACCCWWNSCWGKPFSNPVVAILFLCGLNGVAFGVIALIKPSILITIDPEGISGTWRYPTHAVRRAIRRADLSPATVVEGNEMAPYFYARVCTRQGLTIDLAEGTKRDACHDVCKRFNAAVFGIAGQA
jgi:hypothetical protein